MIMTHPDVHPTLFDEAPMEPAEPSLDEKIARMAASGDRRNRDTGWDPNKRLEASQEQHRWTQAGQSVVSTAVSAPESVPTPPGQPALPSYRERVREARRLGVEAEELDPVTLQPLSSE